MRCRTRQKLDSALFVHLNQQTVTDSYTLSADDQSLDGWHGHRLRGADGTLLNVPDTPETRRVFSVAANQHTAYVQAAAGSCMTSATLATGNLLPPLQTQP